MQEWKADKSGERTVDLMRIGKLLLKRFWVIVLVAASCAVAAYLYAKVMITPTYRSSFTAYVNNRITTEGSANTSSGDLTASVGLSYVYENIIESRGVFKEAAALCDEAIYQYSYTCVSAVVSDTAPILTVYVETEDPDLSKQMADAIAAVAPEHVASVVEGSSMRIIDPPYRSGAPYTPNTARYINFGFILGLLASVAVIVCADLIRDHVSGTDDLENRYAIPVIGQIPDVFQAEKNDRIYGYGKAVSKRK